MTDKPLVPYDWQQADIDKIVAMTSPEVGALVVSAPGAGKTVVAVEAIKRHRPAVTLIIAPPSTHHSAWLRTLKRQGAADAIYPLIGTAVGKRNWEALKWGKPGVYVTSAQWFSRQDWSQITPDAVIFDEIHMVGKYGNVGNKALLGEPKKRGLWAPIRIALSGTPFRNNYENAWSIVRWVEPRKMPKDYWFWRIQDTRGKWDNFAPQNWKVLGEKVPGELASTLTCFISHAQRTACCKYHPEGFLAHLPEPIRLTRDMPMAKDQATFYREMENEYFTLMTTPDESGQIPVFTEFPIAARTMLRFCALGMPSWNAESESLYFEDDCEAPKLDTLIEDLHNLDGKRALVLLHSAQFTQVAAKRLNDAGIRTAEWRGGISQKRRNEILADFLSGELDAIVGVISAMGTGTDGLQEAAYNVMWLSVDEDASNVTQGIGRLDRLGQKHQVTMIEYRHEKTLDVGHLDAKIEKQLELNKSLRAAF